MARSVETIYQDLLAKKEADENLNALSSTSKVAIWRLWLYVIAYACYVMEVLFDTHKSEVSGILTELKPHTLRWYRNKVKAFQYGFDLIDDTDVFDNGSESDETIDASKIIKYAAVTESTTESRLIVKVATENENGILAPIPAPVYTSLVAYLEEIKDAGVKITVINYLPDILKLQMQIYYDPLLLTADGVSILSGRKPVEDSLKEFMKELPFNGELILASLVDKLQSTEGVRIPHLVNAQSKWIATNGITYGNYENIAVKKIPTSGYFQIENFENISYVV